MTFSRIVDVERAGELELYELPLRPRMRPPSSMVPTLKKGMSTEDDEGEDVAFFRRVRISVINEILRRDSERMTEAQKYQAQQAGLTVAQEVLGPFLSVPTAQFLLPQAFQMSRREWEFIKAMYEREPKARNDLQYLGAMVDKEAAEKGRAE